MWYYASGGQQYGPVDDQGLDQLARQGMVRPDTLVWREGMAAWQPYGSLQRPAAPPMVYAPPPAYAPAYTPGPTFDFALWPNRALGALIDGLFVIVMMGLLYVAAFFLVGGIAGIATFSLDRIGESGVTACCCMLLLTPVSTLLVGAYNKVYLLSTRGYSIGQGIMNLKTVDPQGKSLEMGKAFLRLIVQAAMSFIWFLSILDYLWPLWDEKKQTLHDKAASTFVVKAA